MNSIKKQLLQKCRSSKRRRSECYKECRVLWIRCNYFYRLQSKILKGTKFRQWANKILKKYLVNGYVVNISKLKKENQKLKELQNMISVVHRVAI
jgi:hypothetical protein